MASYKLGIKGKLYRSNAVLTNTTWSSSGWDEITNVADVDISIEKSEADATTRNNAGWEQTVGVLKRAELATEIVYGDPTDADYVALRDAFLNDTEIALAMLDNLANSNSTEGFVSNFNITKWGRSEKKDDVMRVPITAKPSSFSFWKTAT